MSLSMKFPGAYFQGKDALEEFAEHTMCYGRSFLFVGSKSALRVSKEKLAHSFSGTDAQIQFELTSGVPCASEIQRVTKLAADSGAQVLCAIGGGGVMDIVRSAAMDLGRAMVMIPTAAASDAPCTFVSVLYSENGQEIVGDRIFHKCPDLVYVDTTIVAQAPVRLLVSGMGDALATWYEMESCAGSGLEMSITAVALCRICRELILENGIMARLAAENHIVIPALERVIEANCFLSGIGGVNTGCSGAHGFGDYLSSLPGGHDYMHGERVMVGLVIQLILEGYQEQEIRRVIRFGRKVGLPVSVAELFEEPIEELAHRIGQDTYNDHFVCHMNCDHSAQAIEGAVRMAVALAKEMGQEELHLER